MTQLGIGVLVGICSWTTATWGQDMDRLSQRLEQAVQRSDWQQALQIVDQMIAAEPDWEPRLSAYRRELEELADPDFPDLPTLPSQSQGSPSGLSTGASTTVTPQETGSQTQRNCGGDLDCLLTAAEQCQPARALFTTTIDQNGISGSGVNDLEIQGPVGGGCRTVTRIESVSQLDLSGVGIDLGSTPNQISQALLEEFLQETVSTCLYTSGSDLRAVLEVDLGQRQGTVGVTEVRPAGGSILQGPMTLDDRQVAQCQIQLPNQFGGVPFDFGDLF